MDMGISRTGLGNGGDPRWGVWDGEGQWALATFWSSTCIISCAERGHISRSQNLVKFKIWNLKFKIDSDRQCCYKGLSLKSNIQIISQYLEKCSKYIKRDLSISRGLLIKNSVNNSRQADVAEYWVQCEISSPLRTNIQIKDFQIFIQIYCRSSFLWKTLCQYLIFKYTDLLLSSVY